MIRFVLILVTCFVSHQALAARSAEVVTDGAMVYEKADFDSTVIGYLQRGQKVRVSNKPRGAFYKVQFSQGVIGYITDVDIKIEGGKPPSQASEDSNKSSKRKKSKSEKKDPEPNETNKEENPWDEEKKDPWDEDTAKDTSFGFGPVINYFFSYSEKRADNLAIDDMNFLTYGLNFTVPIFFSTTLDMSAHFSPYTSKFENFYESKGYKLVEGGITHSFPVLFLDFVVTKVIFNLPPHFSVSLGIGPNFQMNLLKVQTEIEGNNEVVERKLSGIDFGGVALLSLNYHINSVINVYLRPTYRYETTSYFSLALGLTFLL